MKAVLDELFIRSYKNDTSRVAAIASARSVMCMQTLLSHTPFIKKHRGDRSVAIAVLY